MPDRLSLQEKILLFSCKSKLQERYEREVALVEQERFSRMASASPTKTQLVGS
jgi:ERCC4-type nuclease